MRVLILGGTGMLGHQLAVSLDPQLESWVTVRCSTRDYMQFGITPNERVIDTVDALNISSIESAIERVSPSVVINCIGIVKQHSLAYDPVASLTINALLPHQISLLCEKNNARLIHISTDCVFDGRRGHYSENELTNATDLYGRTKSLGEPFGNSALTLRSSIIGRELSSWTGLVEWFLSNRGKQVSGFPNARFSGLTTDEFANVISKVIVDHPKLSGLYHVASESIDKMSLLELLNKEYQAGADIKRDESMKVDRTLDGKRFRLETGYIAPDWSTMVSRMAEKSTVYENWRKLCC